VRLATSAGLGGGARDLTSPARYLYWRRASRPFRFDTGGNPERRELEGQWGIGYRAAVLAIPDAGCQGFVGHEVGPEDRDSAAGCSGTSRSAMCAARGMLGAGLQGEGTTR